MKALFLLGQYNYGCPLRGEGYEYVNFLPAFRALGFEPSVVDTLVRDEDDGFAGLNRRVLEAAARLRPELIFFVPSLYEIWTETLDALRATCDAPIIAWGTDDSWKYTQQSRFLARHVDLWLTTSDAAAHSARAEGLDNVLLTQWAADHLSLSTPLEAAECSMDVSFVGSCYGNRKAWIRRLAREGVKVDCFGHGWSGGTVSTSEVHEIYRRSRISLNFADSGIQFQGLKPYRSKQVKARVFEVPGAGGMLLTEKVRGLGDYYLPGKEVETFSNSRDLVKKIQYLLAHPDIRDAVAHAGHEKTRSDHTYRARFSAVLPAAREHRDRRQVSANPARVMEGAFESHAAPARLRLLRDALVFLPSLIWGRQRGARAARRLLFEASWRLVGPRTYSAQGLPGRLFYRES